MGLGCPAGTLACFAGAAALLAVFTRLELRTEKPLLDVRVFTIPRFTGGALSIAVAFFCLFGFIFLITQYFQFVKGYSTLSAGVHTLPFAIVAAIFTPIAAVLALRIGSRLVVGTGLLLMGGGLLVAGFTSNPAHHLLRSDHHRPWCCWRWGSRRITAPATEAVMGSLAADQLGSGAAVNNTTRELGGTLGVAVFGSIFASAYGPEDHPGLRQVPHPGRTQAGSPSIDGGRIGRHRPRAPSGAADPQQLPLSRPSAAGSRWPASPAPAWPSSARSMAFRLLPGRHAATDAVVEESGQRSGVLPCEEAVPLPV